MIIETKFNIGDNVWFAVKSWNMTLHINGIIEDVHVDKSRKNTFISYSAKAINGIGIYSAYEENIFPTKEELLNSL